MSIDYESYYRSKPPRQGWDDARGSRWRHLSAVVKADHVVELLERADLGPAAERSVLEVGCGDGQVLAELARRRCGSHFTGVEISETAARLARNHPQIDAVVTFDGAKLPFGDGAFDLVIATHVLEHVAEPRSLLREMGRVASELVVLEVPLEGNPLARRPRAAELSRQVGHLQHFRRADVRQLIADAGLVTIAELSDALPRRVSVFQSGSVSGTTKWMLRSLLMRLPAGQRLMTVHYAAMARKPQPAPVSTKD